MIRIYIRLADMLERAANMDGVVQVAFDRRSTI